MILSIYINYIIAYMVIKQQIKGKYYENKNNK